MAETPSNRRRKGRNDFDPNTDPMDIQPYNKNSWWYKSYLKDWLDGWFEAKKAYEKIQKEENETCPYCDNYRGANFCANCGKTLK